MAEWSIFILFLKSNDKIICKIAPFNHFVQYFKHDTNMSLLPGKILDNNIVWDIQPGEFLMKLPI